MAAWKPSKEQQQLLIGAVLVFGGGGFAYIKYFWLPTSAEIKQTKAEIEEVEGKIKKAKTASAKLKRIEEEIAKLNLQAEAAEKRLPKDQNMPKVFELVVDLMKRYNAQLNTFSAGAPATKQHFIEVPYALTLRVGFHDLGRLLSAFALEERIFTPRQVVYSTPDPATGLMNVTFTLVAYQYKG